MLETRAYEQKGNTTQSNADAVLFIIHTRSNTTKHSYVTNQQLYLIIINDNNNDDNNKNNNDNYTALAHSC